MKITTSYKTKITNADNALDATLKIYRQAVSYVIKVVNNHWDDIKGLKGTHKNGYVEKLIHSTESNRASYDFDIHFYKMPTYIRRNVVVVSIGIVSSYRSNLERDPKAKLQAKHFAFPTFYRGGVYKVGHDQYQVELKVYNGSDWVWHTYNLRKSDVDYLTRYRSHVKASNPTLERSGRGFALRFAFEEHATITKKVDRILAIDLGITNDATCVVMETDGTVVDRKIVKLEKDHMFTLHNKVRRNQRRGNRENTRLWTKIKGLAKHYANTTVGCIMELAMKHRVDTIVFEYLEFTGKKGFHKMTMWKHRHIYNTVVTQAHRQGISVSRVNAWNTSRLAFDGSGPVIRGKGRPYSICEFSTGKIYHADLNAAYNIGARYCIKHLLKPLSEKVRLQVEAKVPSLSKRTKCTLSDLRNLVRVLGGSSTLALGQAEG